MLLKGPRVSVAEIQALDKYAIETAGMSSLVLMENAGRAVCGEILSRLRRDKISLIITIFCGTGNNAGDGLVVARLLIKRRIKPIVYLIGKARSFTFDAAVNYRLLKKLKCPIKEVSHIDKTILKAIGKSDIVVDAIFGVGLNRPIGKPFSDFITAINTRGQYIIAVDTPSGLDGTTGQIRGACIKASLTVTFSFLKEGFFKNDGPEHTGKIIVADIGIPRKFLRKI